jgi:hypothetical protein
LAVIVCVLFVSSPSVSAQSSQSVSLAWSPSTSEGITGYVVHYGTNSGVYPYSLDVGNQTTATIGNLSPGLTYYFVVTAYNVLGMSSAPSDEVSYQVPAPPPTLLPVITLTAPGSGTRFTAPAMINLAASVTSNGHAATKVQFYSGATLLGESAAAPYACAWTNVPAGTYQVLARLIYDSGSVTDSVPANITVDAAPVQWQTAALGSAGLLGGVSLTNGLWTITGAGTMAGNTDNFRLVYQGLSANGEILARVQSVGQTGSSARVGIMIRETLAANARCVFLGVSPEGKYRWQRRTKTGGKMSSSNCGTGAPPNVWIRLVRSGNTISGYTSVDGVTWASAGSQSVTMAANIYFGLVVVSGSSTTLNTSAFSDVSLVP